MSLHEILDDYFSKKISIIFHLDASIENCLSRINSRTSSDKFESQGEELLVKIKSAYNQVFKGNNKVIKIMTDEKKILVQQNIAKHLDKLLNAKNN